MTQSISYSSRLSKVCSHRSGRQKVFWGQGSDWQFHCILRSKVNYKSSPDSRDEDIDVTSWWRNLQSHIKKMRIHSNWFPAHVVEKIKFYFVHFYEIVTYFITWNMNSYLLHKKRRKIIWVDGKAFSRYSSVKGLLLCLKCEAIL